jgi:hypothetical protein
MPREVVLYTCYDTGLPLMVRPFSVHRNSAPREPLVRNRQANPEPARGTDPLLQLQMADPTLGFLLLGCLPGHRGDRPRHHHRGRCREFGGGGSRARGGQRSCGGPYRALESWVPSSLFTGESSAHHNNQAPGSPAPCCGSIFGPRRSAPISGSSERGAAIMILRRTRPSGTSE